jgi:chromatin remodeling complex protein RSC6
LAIIFFPFSKESTETKQIQFNPQRQIHKGQTKTFKMYIRKYLKLANCTKRHFFNSFFAFSFKTHLERMNTLESDQLEKEMSQTELNDLVDEDGKPLTKSALKKLEKQREKERKKAEIAERLVVLSIDKGGRESCERSRFSRLFKG